ncbi:hypothetical protein CJ030_MR1G008830 [Morella rubra]|uniref:Disease resistance RPP13-like protein 1 n=1 Tax=Morella rubra TaxID=262757 RepID=A0A6A1WKA5_9ROSI|nr:hypothetical protein CJ030_MR1G008830 [Morella rubra]
MEEWENWSPCEEFPRLRELSIRRCPMLSGELPNQLPLLERIEVKDCARLVVSILRLPALKKITISGCKGLVCGNKDGFRGLFLHSAYLDNISESASQIEGLIDVDDLSIWKCEELMPLCALEHLPETMMYNMTSLESISIHGCDSLRYFARGQLPPTLRWLKISNCKNMRIVLEEDGADSCSSRSAYLLLEFLEIWRCPSLESLTSRGELPATLKDLNIYSCQKLESIAKSLHRNAFLESIIVGWCENLEALPTGIQSLRFLHHLNIFECPNLVPFSDGGREFLPPNLRSFYISDCQKVQGFPFGIQNLTSLQQLRINGCPGISSFREESWPSNLTSLEISHLEITEVLLELGLHRLISLKRLAIKGGCRHLKSFLTPEMMLPASLTSLSITSFPNLQNLSSEGLHRLTSLEKLFIGECKELTSFPEDGLPSSLLELHIHDCEKLTTFPKNGLPPLLLQLRIKGCPLLEENLKKDEGREWSKIANIPCIKIENFLPEEGIL